MELPLRRGDRNVHVEMMQRLLRQKGYRLLVDGDYGPGSERIVKKFQRDENLDVTGVFTNYDHQRLVTLPNDPKVVQTKDILGASEALEVIPAVVYAFIQVEAGGDGFLPSGLPDILFERHIMRRRLRHHGIDVDLWADHFPSLVNHSPGAYLGGEHEHVRLKAACAIHTPSAYESASWGLFQIMGFHWASLGYESVDDFVTQMSDNEGLQLDAVVRFIRVNTTLHQALKDLDWPEIARRYNGPNYKKNNYDVKLEQAFNKYQSVV